MVMFNFMLAEVVFVCELGESVKLWNTEVVECGCWCCDVYAYRSSGV